jgi:transposase
MSAKRTAMRKLREVLRLSYSADLSIRKISASTKISISSIQNILKLAERLNISWPLPEDWDDQTLALKFYPRSDAQPSAKFQEPVWTEVHLELKKKGVTKQLLWEEYSQHYPNRCYSYSQFCARYSQWRKKQKRSMRQSHRAGEKLFIDYAGPTMPVVCASTGEMRTAQIFVAVLGASHYTFAEATWSQSLPDWLGSHVRAFEFFGGTPVLLVPDNLKSGVNKACRYEPELNPSYQQLAAHYAVAVMPARPYKPKDKAKVEVGVQLVERWIMAKLRHQTFFSLAELNHCISALLTELNQKPFKQMPGNRQQWFEKLDQPALSPLPKYPYQYTDIKTARVNIDYHLAYDHHLYSVPHWVSEQVELHAGDKLIEVYFHNNRIAIHVRKFYAGMTTEPGHMPEQHAHHQQWTPGRLMNWAQAIGPEVLKWVKAQLQRKAHPEQAYRVCLGLLSLNRTYSAERLNQACAIANKESLFKLKNVTAILQSNLDKLPASSPVQLSLLPQDHANIRGAKSFH